MGNHPHPATFAPAGSNRSSHGGNKRAEAFGVEHHLGWCATMQAVTRVNVEQASKRTNVEADLPSFQGKPKFLGKRAKDAPRNSTGVMTTACMDWEDWGNTGNPQTRSGCADQLNAREGQIRRPRVAERPVGLWIRGNARGGKGP